jgi:hypothetical protein
MPTLATLTIDGKDGFVIPFKINSDSFRAFNTEDGSITSGIQGGTTSFQLGLDEESDSEAFFAAWFLDKSKKDVNIDITSTVDDKKFLTIQCLDSQCVTYTVSIDRTIDPPLENSFVLIQIVSLSIVVGQSALSRGF